MYNEIIPSVVTVFCKIMPYLAMILFWHEITVNTILAQHEIVEHLAVILVQHQIKEKTIVILELYEIMTEEILSSVKHYTCMKSMKLAFPLQFIS